MRRWALLTALLPLAASAGVKPRYGDALAVALPATPRELDPARAALPSDVAAASLLHAKLLEVDAGGALRPSLLAALPEPEANGLAWRLVLRGGLEFHNGLPVTARDVAASLARLVDAATASPYAWLALPIEGADAYREGRARSISGIQVVNDQELRIATAFPYPELPRALATLPMAIVPRAFTRPVGAGPYRLVKLDGFEALFAGWDRGPGGQPFAPSLSLAGMDARRAAQALERGELDAVVRPDAAAASVEGAQLTGVYLTVNAARLGAEASALRFFVEGAVDRAELARLFVRGPAVPLASLLPPAIPGAAAAPAPPAVAAPPRPPPGARWTLLVSAAADARPVADRIQLKLFDRGVPVAVVELPAAAYAQRLARGDYDLALVSVPFVSTDPTLALAQAAAALGGLPAARSLLAGLGVVTDPAGRDRDALARAGALAAQLPVVPLYATGLRAAVRPGVEGFAFTPEGAPGLADTWILAPRKRP